MIKLSTNAIGLPQLMTRGLGPVTIGYCDSIWGAIQRYFSFSPSLSEVAGFYFVRTPPAHYEYPCIIMTPISSSPELNLSADYWERSLVQFTCVAYTPEQANRIGRNLIQVLSPKRRTSPSTWVARPKMRAGDGYEMAALPGQVFWATIPRGVEGNKNVWACDCQFTFLIGRSMGDA